MPSLLALHHAALRLVLSYRSTAVYPVMVIPATREEISTDAELGGQLRLRYSIFAGGSLRVSNNTNNTSLCGKQFSTVHRTARLQLSPNYTEHHSREGFLLSISVPSTTSGGSISSSSVVNYSQPSCLNRY